MKKNRLSWLLAAVSLAALFGLASCGDIASSSSATIGSSAIGSYSGSVCGESVSGSF